MITLPETDNIYDDIKKVKQVSIINDIPQVQSEVENYEKYFKVEKGDIVVDIGAHVGLFSKRHIGTASKIYAVEPDPLFFKELEVEGIIPVRVGIAGRSGQSLIKSDGNANTVEAKDGVQVEIQTFKKFLKENEINKIGFLKLDCEGAEYDILTEDNLNWLAVNCDKIAGEFHIHNEEHKVKLPLVLFLFDKLHLPYKLASVDGVEISKKHLLSKLNYYTEVMFYVSKELEDNTKPIITTHYVNGCFVEIKGGEEGLYNIKFINNDNEEVLYETEIEKDHWSKCFYQYFINWRVAVSKDGQEVYTKTLDLKDNKVLISLESKSLGDTLAWLPYAEEFRKKHGCEVVCSTFMNSFFKDTYPELQFVEPGTTVNNIMGQYNVGWFYDGDEIDLHRNPDDPKKHPLQKAASDILGLEYKEIRPVLKFEKKESPLGILKYVCIANHSTAQMKYYNAKFGWSTIVNYLKESGYEVVLLSKEKDGYMGNKNPIGVLVPEDYKIETIANYLYNAEFLIGIGSGLTWLAWALNVPAVLISGFSETYTEMQDGVIRIGAPEGKCGGCFNTHKLDAGMWQFCPVHQNNNDRRHECTTSITPESIIEKIQPLINKSKKNDN